MRVFKSTYKDRKGQTTKTGKWYVEFRDHNGDARRVPAFSSKGASEELGRNLDRLVAYHRATGGQVDPALQPWLNQLPDAVVDRLAAVGLVQTERFAARKPLKDHVADYIGTMIAKGNTAKHAKLAHGRITKVFNACGFRYWGDISASKVQKYLATLREPTTNESDEEELGISAATFNYHLGVIKAFCRWMVKDRRATSSPVSHLDMLNVRMDRRHDRRALAEEELHRLIKAAREGDELFGRDREGVIAWRLAGPDRSVLYRLAVESGLRAGELRSLTPESFDLGFDLATVSVAAAYSKRRRDDTLPLLQSTAAMLREYLSDKVPGQPVFSLPRREEFAKMLRKDLEAAGIPYRDSANRVVDFHALRHTFITNLAKGGVHPKTAQMLARHSTITLTMDRYSHAGRENEAEALATLPDLSEDASRAAGEASRNGSAVLASGLARNGRFRAPEGDSGRLNGPTPGRSESPTKHRQNRVKPMGPVGFEPTQRDEPLTNFKSAASAVSPRARKVREKRFYRGLLACD